MKLNYLVFMIIAQSMYVASNIPDMNLRIDGKEYVVRLIEFTEETFKKQYRIVWSDGNQIPDYQALISQVQAKQAQGQNLFRVIQYPDKMKLFSINKPFYGENAKNLQILVFMKHMTQLYLLQFPPEQSFSRLQQNGSLVARVQQYIKQHSLKLPSNNSSQTQLLSSASSSNSVIPNAKETHEEQVDMMFCYAELFDGHNLKTLGKHGISVVKQWNCEASLLLEDLPGEMEYLTKPDFLNGNFIRIYFGKNDMLNNLDAYPNTKVTILTKYMDKHYLLHFIYRFDMCAQFQEMAQKHYSEMMELVLCNLLQSGAEMEGIALWAYPSGKKHFVYSNYSNPQPIKTEQEYHENLRPLPVGSFPWLTNPQYPNHDYDSCISYLLDYLRPQQRSSTDRLAAKISNIQRSKGYVEFPSDPGSNISEISSTPGSSSDSALLLREMSEPQPITLSSDPEPATESCEDMNDANCIAPNNDRPTYTVGANSCPPYEYDNDDLHNIYLCNPPSNFILGQRQQELGGNFQQDHNNAMQNCIPNNPTCDATSSETIRPKGYYKYVDQIYIRTSTGFYPLKTGESPRNPVYTVHCFIKILPITILDKKYGPVEINTDQDFSDYIRSHNLKCMKLNETSLVYRNEGYHLIQIDPNDHSNNLLKFEEDLNGTVKIPEELQSLYPNTCNLLQALLLKNTWYSNPALKPQSDYPIVFIRQIDFLELRTGISGGLGNRAPMISHNDLEDKMLYSLLYNNDPKKPVMFMIHRTPTMATQSKYSYVNLKSNSTWGIEWNNGHRLRYISVPVPIYEIGFYNSEGNFQTTRINSTEDLKELSDYIAQDSQVLWERLTWAREHATNTPDLNSPIYLEEIISLIKQQSLIQQNCNQTVMEDSSSQQS